MGTVSAQEVEVGREGGEAMKNTPTCDCDDRKAAQLEGTDNEGWGALLQAPNPKCVYPSGWTSGSVTPDWTFFPWCGKPLPMPDLEEKTA